MDKHTVIFHFKYQWQQWKLYIFQLYHHTKFQDYCNNVTSTPEFRVAVMLVLLIEKIEKCQREVT